MNFYELGKYKEKIINMFVANEDIVNLVISKPDDNRFELGDNFLGGKYKAVKDGIEEKVNLIGHCFDVPFIYASIFDNRSAICIDTTISRAEGESIKEMTVSIEIMCHKTNLKLDTQDRAKYIKKGLSGNRLDMIVQEVGLQLNSSREFGIGRFKVSPRNPVRSYFPNNDYFGKVLTYTCEDFMTDYSKRSLYGN
ncbi:MAG TPA: hypothetical protein GXZ90_06020 [Clostridiales bacterium]|nr:hypothetical protein [Clostridiales bacterium]